jgi:tRNA threonylcarbamoyladenosine biosynthesis protein TsaE
MHSIHDTRTLLADEAATRELGARLAAVIGPGLKIYLSGELGSGKTTLVRGLLRALGYTEKVKSPTFTLVEVYQLSNLYLYHFDFYRFDRPVEWEDAGFREYFDGRGVCLVEWPENARAYLPEPDLAITLEIQESWRTAVVAAGSETGRRCLERLKFQSRA